MHLTAHVALLLGKYYASFYGHLRLAFEYADTLNEARLTLTKLRRARQQGKGCGNASEPGSGNPNLSRNDSREPLSNLNLSLSRCCESAPTQYLMGDGLGTKGSAAGLLLSLSKGSPPSPTLVYPSLGPRPWKNISVRGEKQIGQDLPTERRLNRRGLAVARSPSSCDWFGLPCQFHHFHRKARTRKGQLSPASRSSPWPRLIQHVRCTKLNRRA